MIQTARLDLIPATLALVSADLHRRDELPALLGAEIGAGWPPPLMTVEAMQRVKSTLQESDPEGWTAYYVVERARRLLIGMGGFKSKPTEGTVEIGYTLLEQFQGQGLGTEFVEGLLSWALRCETLEVVFAETLPELVASQRVLVKNGFVRAASGSEPGVVRYEYRRPRKTGNVNAPVR